LGIISVLEEERRGVSYKMNNRYFEKIIAKIKEVWDQLPHGVVFLTKMKKVISYKTNPLMKIYNHKWIPQNKSSRN
jgi:hypothetical protein